MPRPNGSQRPQGPGRKGAAGSNPRFNATVAAAELEALGKRAAAALALPPALARLPWLEELRLAQSLVPLDGGVPDAWLAPGAFPRLRR